MDWVRVEPTTSVATARWLLPFEKEQSHLLPLFVDDSYWCCVGKLGSRWRWAYSFTKIRLDMRSIEVVDDYSAYDNANN